MAITNGARTEFVCDTVGKTLTVYIRGEIDHHTAVSIRQGIDAMLFERRPERLVMDLSAVGFMDSSGLGLIMGRYSIMRELGGELVVYNPCRETWSILTLAGMERIIRIEFPPDHLPPTGAGVRRGPGASRATTRTPRTPRKVAQNRKKEKDA